MEDLISCAEDGADLPSRIVPDYCGKPLSLYNQIVSRQFGEYILRELRRKERVHERSRIPEDIRDDIDVFMQAFRDHVFNSLRTRWREQENPPNTATAEARRICNQRAERRRQVISASRSIRGWTDD